MSNENPKQVCEESSRIIDAMGGTVAVSETFNLTTGAISQWRYGIPSARLETIKLLKPELFKSS